MILYPAMDLMGGRVVRLAQGRFEDATTYPADPAEALDRFAAAGAEWAHVVDLDGARARTPVQHELIAGLARGRPLKLQVGGGFRTRDQIARMLDAGVARIVIGSLAVDRPDLRPRVSSRNSAATESRCRSTFGWSPACRSSRLPGWTEESAAASGTSPRSIPEARHLLLTDIGRDGMLAGPNFALLDEAIDAPARTSPIQASGGVASLDDLARLRTEGAIVGKALWEGRIGSRRRLAVPARRIIPCLDVKDGRVVKGVQFRDHRDARRHRRAGDALPRRGRR